jgi:predicted MFS family arabinose efflux permease
MRRLPSISGLLTPPSRFAVLCESGLSVSDRQARGLALRMSTGVLLGIFVGSAARIIPVLLAGPIRLDLGWSETDIAGPIAASIAVSALGSPLAARGLLRVGERTLLFASLLVLSASLALSSLATSPWHLLLFWGIGVGLSGSLSASILGAVIGSRDHATHCGTSFGLFTSTQFLGSAAGLLLASRATEALGWRFVLGAAAAATLLAAFAIVLILHARDEPFPRGRPTTAGMRATGKAVRNRSVWVFAAIFFVCGASTTGLIDGRLGILCMDNGFGLSSSADVLALVAVAGGIGSAAGGVLADRYPPRILLTCYFSARAVALLWLPFTSLSLVELARFGAFYGLDAALTFPVLIKLFSRNLDHMAVGPVMSWMMVAHIAGAVITTAGIGFIGMASYPLSFSIVGLMCLLAAGLVMISGTSVEAQLSAKRMAGFRTQSGK